MKMRQILVAAIPALAIASAMADVDVRGNVSLQGRSFLSDALHANQEDRNLSLAAQPEWNWQWNEGKDSFTLELFGRWDQQDDERSHVDIRQAAWIHVGDQIETRIGLRRVFWGVTEFQHLVDIINQSDFVEDVDAEEKLSGNRGRPSTPANVRSRKYGMMNRSTIPQFCTVEKLIIG